MDVLVSNNGDYVVTFDNWHSVGYGDNVVAIYSANTGKLVRKLGLEDFLTESDISALPASVSSIWWPGKHRFDYSSGHLVLQVTKSTRVWDKDAEFEEVRLDLGTGEPLTPKFDRHPSLRYVVAESGTDAEIPEELRAKAHDTCPGVSEEQLLSHSDMSSRIVEKSIPEFTPAARAVGAKGTIVLKISISENGIPQCVKWISGHPLLVKKIADAVEQWRFRPFSESYGGYLVFEANIFTVRPDGTIVR